MTERMSLDIWANEKRGDSFELGVLDSMCISSKRRNFVFCLQGHILHGSGGIWMLSKWKKKKAFYLGGRESSERRTSKDIYTSYLVSLSVGVSILLLSDILKSESASSVWICKFLFPIRRILMNVLYLDVFVLSIFLHWIVLRIFRSQALTMLLSILLFFVSLHVINRELDCTSWRLIRNWMSEGYFSYKKKPFFCNTSTAYSVEFRISLQGKFTGKGRSTQLKMHVHVRKWIGGLPPWKNSVTVINFKHNLRLAKLS